MRTLPRRRRRLALFALLIAAAVAGAAFPWREIWWGGFLLAVTEAGIVGGLADWFAVTAIFRRPLGLPIPHTALIPANWELMAARVGAMVGGRVLTKDYLTREIARLDVADFLARAAGRLRREDLESVTRLAIQTVAEEFRPPATAEWGAYVRRFLMTRPLTPTLATALELARQHGWDERVIVGLATALRDALDRPAIHQVMGEAVDEILVRYRERMGFYPRMWFGLADLLRVIDRDRIVGALRAGLGDVAVDPRHPLRRRLSELAAELPGRLREDAKLAARVEAAKGELLESGVVRRLVEDGAAALGRALATDLGGGHSEVVAWIADRLERLRRALATDAGLRRDLDQWIKRHAIELVEQYHQRAAVFIQNGVLALGPEGAVRLIEEHAGDDLQYIRLNGTVVGGLAGGVLYALHLLLKLL